VINNETFAPIALEGHTDSVVAAKWSHDGDMVATGGMDGKVRVYKYNQTDGWPLITELDAGSEIQWIQWHPKGPVLAAGCEDSSVWLWQCELMLNLAWMCGGNLLAPGVRSLKLTHSAIG
jgi:ribosome assembly protein SQT1